MQEESITMSASLTDPIRTTPSSAASRARLRRIRLYGSPAALAVVLLLSLAQPAGAQDAGVVFQGGNQYEITPRVQRDFPDRQWEEPPGQRALREQAQRNNPAYPAHPGTQYNRDNQYNRERHDEWVQRQQQRRQQETLQGPQLDMQRRQGEEPIGQRALREQAQMERENERFRQEAQRRSGGVTTPNSGNGGGYKR
jgi:hypothetical protein